MKHEVVWQLILAALCVAGVVYLIAEFWNVIVAVLAAIGFCFCVQRGWQWRR